MTEPEGMPDLLATVDQRQAELAGIAPMFGTYYLHLLASGCSEKLARDLVRDLHYERVVNPDAQTKESP